MSRRQKPVRLYRHGVRALGMGLLLAATGCVSNGYKLAPKSTPPPVVLNLTAAPEPIEATLHTVIVFQGPGSWKRSAYWDEYVITLANRGPEPLTLDSATITDFQGKAFAAGSAPWALEKQSRDHIARLKSTGGTILKIGGGTVISGTAGILGGAAVGPMIFGPSFFGPALEGAATGFVVAIPIYALSSVYLNLSRKHQVEAEFQRRRLVLPATVASGQTAQGSLFFPITPGPQQLALHWTGPDAEAREVVVELGPLAGLHLKSADEQKTSAP